MRRLEGRVAWVTGSSSGNGRAIAFRLAAEGAAIVCSDVRPEPDPRGFDGSTATDVLVRDAGGKSIYVNCNVTVDSDCQKAVGAALAAYGRLDIVVANAGVAPLVHDLVHEEFEDYARVIDVNQHGVWRTCKAAVGPLVAQGSGRIIVLSSIAGLVGIDAGLDYNMSKHAVMGLVRTLARQVGGSGVTVNAVNPGYIRTAMLAESLADPARTAALEAKAPLDRMGSPEDVAAAVAFLASDDAAFITGIALPVDGGYTAV